MSSEDESDPQRDDAGVTSQEEHTTGEHDTSDRDVGDHDAGHDTEGHDTDDHGASEHTAGEQRAGRTRRIRLPGNLVVAAAAFLVVALAFAGWFGVSWWRSSSGGAADIANARDNALQAGQSAVMTLVSLDYRKPKQSLQRWQDVTTGQTREDVKGNLAAYQKSLKQAETITKPELLDAALSELHPDKGEAVLLAALQINVRQKGGESTTKPMRLEATLKRVDNTWKVSGVGQVPIQQGDGQQGGGQQGGGSGSQGDSGNQDGSGDQGNSGDQGQQPQEGSGN